MRKKSLLRHRVYVRRRFPRPAVLLLLFIALLLVAFVRYARPAIHRLALDLDQAPVASERITRDVGFDALSLYLVELKRSDQADAARVEAARYVPRGAAGYVLKDGEACCVIGAGFSDKADAERVAAQLKQDEAIDARIHVLTGEAALLRVTATEAQLKALVEGEGALRALTPALAAHALALDRGMVEPAGLRAALSIEAEQAGANLARLKKAAGEAPNAVAAGLIERLAALEDACRRLSADSGDSALILSSRLKYAFIDLRAGHIEFLQELTGG